MASGSAWKVLKVQHESLPPQLLIRFRVEAGYSIHFTDLSRVWGEGLTKRELVRRALNEECPIDPTDGGDQYDILVSKIKDALSQKDGTSLSIRAAATTPEGSDDLTLSLTAPLPAGLGDLKWDIKLKLLPVHHIADELVTPLLRQVHTLKGQMSLLVQELHDKDRIISKITDRLETSGNDLTTVFPGVSNVKTSRKRSQREQLAKHVKGLADFDETEWRTRKDGASAVATMSPEDLDGTLANMATGAFSEEGERAEWWRQLGKEGVPGSDGRSERLTSKREHLAVANGLSDTEEAADEDMADGDDDSEFQRQATPPRTKHEELPSPRVADQAKPVPHRAANHHQPVKVGDPDDDSTEDEDDLDAPARKSQSSQRSGSTAPGWQPTATPDSVASSPRKLGTIGGRKSAPSPQKETSPDDLPAPSPAKPRSKLGAIGGRSKASATPEPAPAPSLSALKPQAKKLGAIGGKAKQSASPAPEPTSSAPSPAKKGKLGMIGGRKREAPAESSVDRAASEETVGSEGINQVSQALQSRATSKKPVKEPTPPPAETEEERANRKRDELKRQLEEKAKAPVKKKRKF